MNTYRMKKNSGTVMEGGQKCGPGDEIKLSEERAAEMAGTLELDNDGKPVIVKRDKAVERPPENKMFGKSKSTRKDK